MTTDFEISFYSCHVPQEQHFAVPAAVPPAHEVISVSPDASDSSYSVIEGAARSFRGWITVTAKAFARAVVSRVREFVRKSFRNSGLDILRRTAVLRI